MNMDMIYLISMINFILINVQNLPPLIKQIFLYKDEMKSMVYILKMFVLIYAHIKNLKVMKIKYIVVVF